MSLWLSFKKQVSTEDGKSDSGSANPQMFHAAHGALTEEKVGDRWGQGCSKRAEMKSIYNPLLKKLVPLCVITFLKSCMCV